MKLRTIIFVICVSSINLLLLTSSFRSTNFAWADWEDWSWQSEERQSDYWLCEKANSITVKVLVGDSFGSGILWRKEGSRYTILTSGHLFRRNNRENSYQIETPDGKFHLSSLIESFGNSSEGNDLAILEFNSTENYQLADWALRENLKEGQEVLALGFPVKYERIRPRGERGQVCLYPGGKVSAILDRPMEGGYQIGFYIDIAKGMSGGPILNNQGQVIGINGKHNDPLITTHGIYHYSDGSPVNQSSELLAKSSWAIPVDLVCELGLCPQDSRPPRNVAITTETESPSDRTTTKPPRTDSETQPRSHRTTKVTPKEIKKIAEEITVLIIDNSDLMRMNQKCENPYYEANSDRRNCDRYNNVSTNPKYDSGVIIEKRNNIYYVLGNWTRSGSEDKYKIVTFNQQGNKQEHKVNNYHNLQYENLVIFEFTSNHDYKTAKFKEDVDSESKQIQVYIAGQKNRQNILPLLKEELNNFRKNPQGYELLTVGSLLNQSGKLIGIHRTLPQATQQKSQNYVLFDESFRKKIEEKISLTEFSESSPSSGDIFLPNCNTRFIGDCDE